MHTRREAAEAEGFEPGSESRTWLQAEMFEALAEINEDCLELLAAQSMARTLQSHPLLRELAELWRTLDAGARRRAAACPYLIVDAGFADTRRWRFPGGHEVTEPCVSTVAAAFFTVQGADAVVRRVLLYARELARTNSVAARMLLGMPAQCATLIGGCTLRQVDEISARNASWLRPRWPNRVPVWRELLVAARAGEGAALELARMHGLQLLAAEMRASGMS